MSGVRVDPSKLREVEVADLAVRFGFGAGISIVAGLISLAFGPRAGGLFLAFPAILPATLTLLQQKHTKKEAEEDDEGAVLGAAALVPFALVTYLLLASHPGWFSLGAASLAWLASAVGLYVVVFGSER
jgi:hypothetical protein